MSVEIRALREDELPAWFDLVAKVFARTNREHFINHWYEDPFKDIAGILVAEENGRLVSTLRVFRRKVVIDGSVVGLGGIGEVATHADYRRQGLSGRLIQASIEDMQQHNCGLSILFTGLSDHYRRYNWESVAIPTLKLSNFLFPTMTNFVVRPVDYAADLFRLIHIYQESSSKLAGPITRTPEYWWTYIRRAMQSILVAESHGTPVGYMRTAFDSDKNIARIMEFGVLPGAQACGLPLLQAALTQAEAPIGYIVEMPAAVDLLAAGAFTAAAQTESVTSGAPMYRVVDPLTLVQQLQMLWQRRLQAAGWQGIAQVDIGIGSFILHVSKERLIVARGWTGADEASQHILVKITHQQFLTALLLGYQQANIDPSTMSFAGAALLQALFPTTAHVFWRADGF